MSQTDQILIQVLDQLKTLTAVVEGNSLSTCDSRKALMILGLNDPRYLTYFNKEGLIDRKGGGKGGYRYYIDELMALAAKIRGGLHVPKLKDVYSKRKPLNPNKAA